MKKRIKTCRLTNIYHSNDDDVGDGYNLLSHLSLSLSLLSLVSLGPSPASQDSCQQSHCANFFKHGILSYFCYWLQPKADFSNITVIISALHGLRVFNIIADFMGCSMNLTVARQRPSVQNSIVVLFPDIFMNFWAT